MHVCVCADTYDTCVHMSRPEADQVYLLSSLLYVLLRQGHENFISNKAIDDRAHCQ